MNGNSILNVNESKRHDSDDSSQGEWFQPGRPFVEKLFEDKFVSLKEKEEIFKKVRAQHANTNGYDVRYDGEYGDEQ